METVKRIDYAHAQTNPRRQIETPFEMKNAGVETKHAAVARKIPPPRSPSE